MTTSKTKTWLLFVAILLFCHHSVIFFHQIRENVGFCRMARRLQMVFHEQNVHEERESTQINEANKHSKKEKSSEFRRDGVLELVRISSFDWPNHWTELKVTSYEHNRTGGGASITKSNGKIWTASGELESKAVVASAPKVNCLNQWNHRVESIACDIYILHDSIRWEKIGKNGKNDVKKEATMAKVVTNELRCWRFEMQGIHSHVPTLLGYPEHFSLARYVRMRNCRTKPVVCADDGRSRLCEADVFTVGTIRYNTWSSHVNINY